MATSTGIEIRGAVEGRAAEILNPIALEFVADLHRRFNPTRERLLALRSERQARLDAGERPGFLEATRSVREEEWRVADPPADLRDRRVEITGPVERKMMINALNSGAKVFMADLEDANSPTWENNIQGQANLIDAIEGSIEFSNPDGRRYTLNETVAALLVRPRGWHMVEKHLLVDGEEISASLLDFGLYFFHNARRRIERGSGIYLYLPKMESHLEARLWNDVFVHAEDTLGVPRGTVRATVLIETILAAFEMDEILYELREHSLGLNAGRWDYIFSCIKKFRNRDDMPAFPDRGMVTMTVPFMRAYTELLVRTCHRRAAFAMGGMAAFIPSRRDAEINETAMRKVREDKEREAAAGFDGTWVAHPDLVAVAMEAFDAVLGERPNQIDRRRDDVEVTAGQLIDFAIPGAKITEAGVRQNVSVGIQYLASWLNGNGAAAIFNLMEDAATAEISRSQLWQWVRRGARMEDGRPVTEDLVRSIEDEEVEKVRAALGADAYGGKLDEARRLFREVALDPGYPEFLTLPAYRLID